MEVNVNVTLNCRKVERSLVLCYPDCYYLFLQGFQGFCTETVMWSENRMKTGTCPCCKVCEKCPGFQTILDRPNSGFILYRHTTHVEDINKATGAIEAKTDTIDDVYIIENTQGPALKKIDFFPEIDRNQITCPRCVNILKHAQSLFKNQDIGNSDVIGVCEHCRQKSQRGRTCPKCDEIVEKFQLSKNEGKQTHAERVKTWLSKIQQLLTLALDADKNKERGRLIRRGHSDIDISKLFRKGSKTDREPEIEDLFLPNIRGLQFSIKGPASERSYFPGPSKDVTFSDVDDTKPYYGTPQEVGDSDRFLQSRSNATLTEDELEKDFIRKYGKSYKEKRSFEDPTARVHHADERFNEIISSAEDERKNKLTTDSDWYHDGVRPKELIKELDSRRELDRKKDLVPKESKLEGEKKELVSKTGVRRDDEIPDEIKKRATRDTKKDDFTSKIGKRFEEIGAKGLALAPKKSREGKKKTASESRLELKKQKDIVSIGKGQKTKSGTKILQESPSRIKKYRSDESLLAGINKMKQETKKDKTFDIFFPEKPGARTKKPKEGGATSRELIKETMDKLKAKTAEEKTKREQAERKGGERSTKLVGDSEDKERKLSEKIGGKSAKDADREEKDKLKDGSEQKEAYKKGKEASKKDQDAFKKDEDEYTKDRDGSKKDVVGSKKDVDGSKKDEDRYKKDGGASRKDGDGFRKDMDVTKKEKDVSKKDGDGSRKDMDVTKKDVLKKDGDGSRKDMDVTKKEKDVSKKDGDGSRKDLDGSKKDVDGSNKDKDAYKKDQDGSRKDVDGSKKDKDALKKVRDSFEKDQDATKKGKDASKKQADDQITKEKSTAGKMEKGKDTKSKDDDQNKSDKTKAKEGRLSMDKTKGKKGKEDKEMKSKEGTTEQTQKQTSGKRDPEADKLLKGLEQEAKEREKLQQELRRQKEEERRLKLAAEQKVKDASQLNKPPTRKQDFAKGRSRTKGLGDKPKERRNVKSLTPAEINIHKQCHQHIKDKNCVLCNDSTLELDLLSLLRHKQEHEPKDAFKEVIIGEEVHIFKTHMPEPPVGDGIKPILFRKQFDIYEQEIEYSKLNLTPDLEPEGKPKTKMSKAKKAVDNTAEIDQDYGKGVVRYALSDRTFIEKGWTMLPTEKVVRKMNVYRMRPAHPEFDWFEHNKNKGMLEYDTGERLAEFDDTGRGRWYYRNGKLALDYYDAEELNAQQRFVIYSSGEPDERGRSRPRTVLATFDYLGNGCVFDHAGKIRLKYNQTEGIVLDRTLGPVSHWKWHTLNDPPILQQVMIDTQMAHKDPQILKLGGPAENKPRPDDEEMLAIEFDNFIKEKSAKLSQSFKPFQIKMKALKINEYFSLRVLDQATVYLIYRDGSTNIKLNIGMILDHKEIVDTDTAEVGEVSNNAERLPARTDSLAELQRNVANAQRIERCRSERERRLRRPEPCASADRLIAAASRPLRLPLRTVDSLSTVGGTNMYCKCRKPTAYNNVYYDTSLI